MPGKKGKLMCPDKRCDVPRVNLLDPDVEPTDEELEKLFACIARKVVKRSRKAKEKLQADIEKAFFEAKKRGDL